MDFNLREYLNVHGKGYVIKTLYLKDSDFVINTIVDGYAEVEPKIVKMEENFLFDVASLTKTITAIIVHKAVERGLISLNNSVKMVDDRFIYLDNVSILDLLTHKQELWTDGYLGSACSKEEFLRMLFNSRVKSQKRTYIDSHYIILSILLEKIYSMSFDEIVKKEIIDVLNLRNTKFKCDVNDDVVSNNFETVKDNLKDDIKVGIVHDSKARKALELGFTVGHAGIFTTAADFLEILKSLIDGKYKLLSRESIKKLILHDDASKELLALTKQFIIDNSISVDSDVDLNDMYKKIVDLGYNDFRLSLFRPYNYFGTRYRNVIDDMNDIPDSAGDDTILFSGYTGPLFLIDFNKKIIIVVMTNVCHCNVLSRDLRYNMSRKLIKELYNKVLKQITT